MVDLSTSYLGLRLKNPLVVAASPLGNDLDKLRRMEAAGAGAVVLPSLFEEQIRIDEMLPGAKSASQRRSLPPGLQHIPEMKGYNRGVNGYVAHLHATKRALSIPVIASLNAYSKGGWAKYARILEAVGADALELNVYHLETRTHIDAAEVEETYLKMVNDVCASVRDIPVTVKLSPFFSAPANIAQRLADAGATGLVFFNRFYQPDINIETRNIELGLELSTSTELRLRLRWVALLARQINADLAVTGGVHTVEDVIKSLMAGAKVAMIASALFERGIDYLRELHDGLESWLEDHGCASCAEIQGVLANVGSRRQAALERANYLNVLGSYQPPEEGLEDDADS